MNNYTFFWGGVFSNWYPFENKKSYSFEQLSTPLFGIGGVFYNSAEQYMMAKKAQLFGDQLSLQAIMQPIHPREAKSFGRKVKNFDADLWNKVSAEMVLPGLFAKFAQNPHLLQSLLDTGDSILVEASPTDTVWGIGLTADDPRAQQSDTWLGQNRLGYTLTFVRDILKSACANAISSKENL